ncbi:cation transport protein-domain-containing protein [Tricharina praecox]|uniref:cation transport protein-domain-containing protein n=1 Tax=Tricharina praecox TaxID=43433 RepID=UPI00221E7E76|nr:cation transport protein-domain-containing protein [Tricharina praecox]KAI5842328.1 cation transport protein-domain-containing protein [Tricharina praecox]
MVEPLPGIRPSSRSRSRGRGLLRLGRLVVPRRFRHTLNSIGTLGWHAIYFSAMCLVASFIFYGVGRNVESKLGDADGIGERMSYLDALFLGVTSATGAGLGNVVLSRLDTLQQFVAFLLILAGSQVWVAACVVNIQRAFLARKILDRCREEEKKKRQRLLLAEQAQAAAGNAEGGEGLEKLVVLAALQDHSSPPVEHVSHGDDEGIDEHGNAHPLGLLKPGKVLHSQCTTAATSRNCSSDNLALVFSKENQLELISTAVGLDSACSLKEDQERLAALTLLSWMVPVYLVVFQVVGTICLGIWMSRWGKDIVAVNALNSWWWAAFNAISAFNNSGMSLLDAGMVPFANRGSFVVVVQCALILAGNSAFPVILKGLLLLLRLCGYKNKGLLLLLDGSRCRKVFPYLFPPRETKWLIAMLIILNGIDVAAFQIAAPSSNDSALRALSNSQRFLAGLFQALSVRSGGFAIVSIRDLHMGVQMAYTVMLYTSAFPLALPGIPHRFHASPHHAPSLPESAWSFVLRQLRGLMRAGDLRYLVAAVWFICVVESPGAAGAFPILFEVASAFGCVGVSFGAQKDGRLALVGDWGGASKMALAAVMLWGRTREVRRGVLKGWGRGRGRGDTCGLVGGKDVSV